MKKFILYCLFIIFNSCINDNLRECSSAIPDINSENGQRIRTIRFDFEIGPPNPCL